MTCQYGRAEDSPAHSLWLLVMNSIFNQGFYEEVAVSSFGDSNRLEIDFECVSCDRVKMPAARPATKVFVKDKRR